MGTLISLLRLFFIPHNWPWLTAIAAALLPAALVAGLWSPRLGFGLAVWDYVLLLAMPFMLAPRLLRMLLCNRRLLLVPGFASHSLLAALVFTVLHSAFVSVFAYWFDMPGEHLRNACLLFVVSSIYLVVMQYAVTTAWALFILSLFPVVIVASVLFVLQGHALQMLGDDHLLWLAIATLLGWLLAWQRVQKAHRFTPEHRSITNLKGYDFQHVPVAAWLVGDADANAAPDATMLLGFAATPAARLQVLLWHVLLGPVIATLFLSQLEFGGQWSYQPGVVDIFLGCSLFPLTFGTYQHVDCIARLRLLWLRRPLDRSGLWRLLESQFWLSIGLMLAIACVMLLLGMAFTGLPPALLLHYPLLVLSFNAFYSYYSMAARCSLWSPLIGFLLSLAGSGLIYGGLWLAIHSQQLLPLYLLEVVIAGLALLLRGFARQRFSDIDWLRVKPLRATNVQQVAV